MQLSELTFAQHAQGSGTDPSVVRKGGREEKAPQLLTGNKGHFDSYENNKLPVRIKITYK